MPDMAAVFSVSLTIAQHGPAIPSCHFDGQRYRLLAWAVMPNHAHVLFQPIGTAGRWQKPRRLLEEIHRPPDLPFLPSGILGMPINTLGTPISRLAI